MAVFSKSYFREYVSANNPIRAMARRWLSGVILPGAVRRLIRAQPSGRSALDVGCGTGRLLAFLEATMSDVATTGVDIGAPPEFHAKGHFARASAFDLPFPDNSFDLVFCSHVIEHLVDPQAVLSELTRVCRPGGYVYVETPSARSILTFLGGRFWDDPTHVRPYSPAALRWLGDQIQMQDIRCGYRRSLAAILLGIPYSIVGSLLGDQQATSFFSASAFGFNAYMLARKSNGASA
jgi:SAM-dependent methyltransferase